MCAKLFVTTLALLGLSVCVRAAGVVTVAPFDASPAIRAKADFVCAGKDDQIVLMKSLRLGPRYAAHSGGPPNRDITHAAQGRQEVRWLSGTYNLSGTLEIRNLADTVIDAQGTYMRYARREGDAILIAGMQRCRYDLGTIESHSSGGAITVRGGLMSIITFTGLIGYGQRGVGLHLLASCTNRYEGTDVAGFDVGILVDDVSPKTDTNWFWCSYIRQCNTCIWEKGRNVDDNVWYVNVDASIPNAVAIRTAAYAGWWHIIMGTFKFEHRNKAIILDPGARSNVMFVQPPLATFAWEDNSGNKTNSVFSATELSRLLAPNGPPPGGH